LANSWSATGLGGRAVAEIGTRAEAVAGTGDHEHPIGAVLGHLVEQLGEADPHLVGQRVLLGRPVEGARHHTVGALDEQRFHPVLPARAYPPLRGTYRSGVGFNPFRQQVKRRSDIVLVVVALLVVALLVLWAAYPR
jgi:hypothetical protein